KTQCERHRDRIQTNGLPLVGAYVPQCDENGLYVPEQCHGSTGYCWCVDSRGQERAGTRTGPGSPSVDCRTGETMWFHPNSTWYIYCDAESLINVFNSTIKMRTLII
uniref:Thyroglobulin type-1 domain-containing protein n=1 Tax=Xiphophorus maculatus TaxID=8083 RepID=A0A3B5Q4M3_XIPMA